MIKQIQVLNKRSRRRCGVLAQAEESAGSTCARKHRPLRHQGVQVADHFLMATWASEMCLLRCCFLDVGRSTSENVKFLIYRCFFGCSLDMINVCFVRF